MAILLISWVCASTVICVAFLSVASRPVPPRLGEQVAASGQVAFGPERGGRLRATKRAYPLEDSALPSASRAA